MDQGVIELSDSLKKDFNPDKIILDFKVRLIGGSEEEIGILTSASIRTLQDKVNKAFEGFKYMVDTTDYCINRFGEEEIYDDRDYECNFTFILDIVFKSFENLYKVEQFIMECLNYGFVDSCSCKCDLADREELERTLKADVVKKCRVTADVIAESAGCKVIDITRIVCEPLLSNDECQRAFKIGNTNGSIYDVYEHKITISSSMSCVFSIGRQV